VTVRRGNEDVQEQRTNWYPTSGVVSNQFNDVSGLANSGLDTPKVQALEPWPMEYVVPHQQEYIAGHLSRTYDYEPDRVFGELIQPQLDSAIESTIRADIGGDEQRISSKNITWNMLQFAHVLLPVWLLTVTYDQKPFQVFINGVTGEVQGNRPLQGQDRPGHPRRRGRRRRPLHDLRRPAPVRATSWLPPWGAPTTLEQRRPR
jgi:hypothetical protein